MGDHYRILQTQIVRPWDWTRVAYAAEGANYHAYVSLRLARASLWYVTIRRHLRNSLTSTFTFNTRLTLWNESEINVQKIIKSDEKWKFNFVTRSILVGFGVSDCGICNEDQFNVNIVFRCYFLLICLCHVLITVCDGALLNCLLQNPAAALLLRDERFTRLFTDADFQIDEQCDEYQRINPVVSKKKISKLRKVGCWCM